MSDIVQMLRDPNFLGQQGMRELAAAEIERLRADATWLRVALQDCAYVAEHGTPAKPDDPGAVARWIVARAQRALAVEQAASGESK